MIRRRGWKTLLGWPQCLLALACLVPAPLIAQDDVGSDDPFPADAQELMENAPPLDFQRQADRTVAELDEPVRLEVNGRPLDVGQLSSIAHAGPWIGDVDNDGDRDLLVGDFPGYIWLVENEGTDAEPRYAGAKRLKAGNEAAKTPVY